MGQLIAYARMTGVVPPCSEKWDLVNTAVPAFACLPAARHAPGNRPTMPGNEIDRDCFCE
jgi:hypothetical protein